jgi:hypothetical protein
MLRYEPDCAPRILKSGCASAGVGSAGVDQNGAVPAVAKILSRNLDRGRLHQVPREDSSCYRRTLRKDDREISTRAFEATSSRSSKESPGSGDRKAISTRPEFGHLSLLDYRRQMVPAGKDKPCPYILLDHAALRDKSGTTQSLSTIQRFATTL